MRFIFLPTMILRNEVTPYCTCCTAPATTKQAGYNLAKYCILPIKAISEGLATPMIIVMPDANTGKRGYFNDVSGNNGGTKIFSLKSLCHLLEKTYRIKTEKRSGQLPVFPWAAADLLCMPCIILNYFLLPAR